NGQYGQPQSECPQPMGHAFGNNDIRSLEAGEKEQAQSAFTALAADAIGGQQWHENPNCRKESEMKAAEEAAAEMGGKAVLDGKQQAGQQERAHTNGAQPISEGVARRGAQFPF